LRNEKVSRGTHCNSKKGTFLQTRKKVRAKKKRSHLGLQTYGRRDSKRRGKLKVP